MPTAPPPPHLLTDPVLRAAVAQTVRACMATGQRFCHIVRALRQDGYLVTRMAGRVAR